MMREKKSRITHGCHCEEAVCADEAIPNSRLGDCFVAPLLAMTNTLFGSDQLVSFRCDLLHRIFRLDLTEDDVLVLGMDQARERRPVHHERRNPHVR